MKTKEQQYLDVLEEINTAYDNAGLAANYTPQMRKALTNMKMILIINATT